MDQKVFDGILESINRALSAYEADICAGDASMREDIAYEAAMTIKGLVESNA